MRQKVRLSEVARSAGVSVQTVSNVANGKPVVGKKTLDLVLKHLLQSGYRGNALARSLRSSKSRMIGLVVPSMTNSMYAEVAESIVKEAELRGYTVMVCVTKRDPAIETELVNTIIDHSAAGILISPSDPNAVGSKLAISLGIPYVEMLNRGLSSGCDVFEADNYNGAREAVEYLIKLGHTDIAHISGVSNSTGNAREEGYRAALRDAGIAQNSALLICGDYTRSGGLAACQQLLASGQFFSAIFCASDLMAYGAMEALNSAGRKVPKDVSIIGFDDMSLSSFPGIGLTTVSFMPGMLAKDAVERLIARIEQVKDFAEPIHEVAKCQLIIRTSAAEFAPEVTS